MPITWQNINAPSLGDPGRTLANAGQAITDAFTPLREQLKAYQTNEASNVDIDRKNRLDGMQATIMARFPTAQAYAAAKEDGTVASMMRELAPQDQLAGAKFADDRTGVLQQRDLAERTYKNQVIEDTNRPLYQKVLARINAGDRDGVTAMLKTPEFAPLAAMKEGELMGKMKEFELATAEEGRKVSGENRAVVAQEELLRNGDASRKNAAGMLGVAQRNAQTNADQVQLTREGVERTREEQDRQLKATQLTARLTAVMKDNLYKDGVVIGDRLPELGKIFTDNKILEKDSDSRAQILKVFEKGTIDISVKGPDGKTQKVNVPIPMAAAKQAILSAETRHWGWGARGMDTDAAENLRNILQEHYTKTVPGADGKPQQVISNRAVDDYQAYLGIQGMAPDAAGGVAQKKTPARPAFPKPR